jgi:phage terminase large subunit-like protein
LLDEIHEHPSNAMVEFMRAGTKGRRQALIVMATNSGYDRLSVCYHYHDYGIKLLTGQEESNDAFFAYICSLDSCASCWASGYVQPNADCPDCDDWRDPKVWMKANPLLGVTITHKYLEEQVRDATGMPSKQSIVRRLNFCEWTESATPFIGADVWKANGAMPSEEALRKYPVFGALDLSGKNALTALVIGCQDENSKVHVKPYAWTPEKGLKDRQEKDGAPYARWVEEKHLKTTPGATIDFEFVAAELARIHADYNLHGVAFDRWRIEDFKRSCQKIGLEAWIEGTDEPIPGGLRLVPHGQGFRDMSPAIDHLEDDLKESRLCHGNHPVLTMCVANCTTEMDAAGLRKFSKARSTGRIDLAQALAMVETVIKGAPREAEKAYQAYFF